VIGKTAAADRDEGETHDGVRAQNQCTSAAAVAVEVRDRP
jgi:hypothetical protein